jgi:hypothetical protein
MKQHPFLQKADWPRWTWQGSSWWLTAVGAIVGLLVIAFPSLISHQLWIRLTLALICCLLPTALLLVIYSAKALVVGTSRLRSYDELYKKLERRSEELIQAQETILYLSQELTSSRRFEIDKVLDYANNLYIVLKKKRGAKLSVGNTLAVIDFSDGSVMGVFEVTEVRAKEYRAISTSFVNAVWLGFIRQSGRAESAAPPHTAAILMVKEGEIE